MLLIDCPHCGPRATRREFSYGARGPHRPAQDSGRNLSDAEWADYVFLRDNHQGCHPGALGATPRGCRRWFNLARATP